jgi:hypothetical protein
MSENITFIFLPAVMKTKKTGHHNVFLNWTEQVMTTHHHPATRVQDFQLARERKSSPTKKRSRTMRMIFG